MIRFSLTVVEADRGWVVQPVYSYRPGWWLHARSIAGPFKTRREAREARREMLPGFEFGAVRWRSEHRGYFSRPVLFEDDGRPRIERATKEGV